MECKLRFVCVCVCVWGKLSINLHNTPIKCHISNTKYWFCSIWITLHNKKDLSTRELSDFKCVITNDLCPDLSWFCSFCFILSRSLLAIFLHQIVIELGNCWWEKFLWIVLLSALFKEIILLMVLSISIFCFELVPTWKGFLSPKPLMQSFHRFEHRCDNKRHEHL